eukprot:1193764-Prorocentrum_minimum.AAC.1
MATVLREAKYYETRAVNAAKHFQEFADRASQETDPKRIKWSQVAGPSLRPAPHLSDAERRGNQSGERREHIPGACANQAREESIYLEPEPIRREKRAYTRSLSQSGERREHIPGA